MRSYSERLPRPTDVRVRIGEVSALTPTLTVLFAGEPFDGLDRLRSYTPAVGDIVLVLFFNGGAVVAGAIV